MNLAQKNTASTMNREALYLALLAVPAGKVITYGQLAALAAESPISLVSLSPAVKLAMGVLMIVGRLETLVLLVFLVPATLRR